MKASVFSVNFLHSQTLRTKNDAKDFVRKNKNAMRIVLKTIWSSATLRTAKTSFKFRDGRYGCNLHDRYYVDYRRVQSGPWSEYSGAGGKLKEAGNDIENP